MALRRGKGVGRKKSARQRQDQSPAESKLSHSASHLLSLLIEGMNADSCSADSYCEVFLPVAGREERPRKASRPRLVTLALLVNVTMLLGVGRVAACQKQE
jgi:hypothetical protein